MTAVQIAGARIVLPFVMGIGAVHVFYQFILKGDFLCNQVPSATPAVQGWASP
jgi:hypothetical protein